METLLSPREFIKRFHLPQLIRISLPAAATPDDPQDVAAAAAAAAARNQDETIPRKSQNVRNNKPPGNPFLEASRRIEQRDPSWTYSSGAHQHHHYHLQPQFGDENEDDEEDEVAAASGSRSLHFADHVEKLNAHGPGPVSLLANLNGAGADAGDGPPAARMLPRVKLSRVTSAPRAESFCRTRPAHGDKTFLRPASSSRKKPMGSHQGHPNRLPAASPLEPPSPCANIKLMPPSKRPTLSKLELEQPFLIYKAHRKLEICAYAADSNNELHDKSGDPIFFPQNYQGELLL